MSTVWKVLLALALVVPAGAYVTGSLVASAADDPAPRHTVVISEPRHPRTPSRAPSPTGSPTRSPDAAPEDPSSPEVEVITPEYDDLGDDHGGERGGHGGHGGGGSSGPGPGGGSDDSGHGGGED